MGFLLSSLGLPVQSGAAHSGAKSSGLPIDPALFVGSSNASSFGSVFSGQFAALPVAVNGTASSGDPLEQLTAQVQNGTPISTIVDRLAGQIADAVQARVPAAQPQTSASRTQLYDSIKAALSPPANAPPGTTATQEVAALARRLTKWIGNVARGADQRAGQKSDTSGQILDADQAKELPAQHDPNSTPSRPPSVIARALLSSVAASSQSTTQPSSTTAAPLLVSAINAAPVSLAVPVSAFASLPASGSANGASIRIDPLPASSLASNTELSPSPASASSATPATAGAAQAAPVPTANANAPSSSNGAAQDTPADLVARMIARAAGVDARVNNGDASIAPPVVQTTTAQRASDSGGTPVPGNALQAARTTTLLTQAIAAASESNGGNASGNQTGGGTRNDDALTDAGASNKTAATPVAGPDSSTTLAVNAAAPPSSAPLAASQPQNAPATDLPAQSHVDPDAVVEQVVKSMMMRTASDGTSEVRLRLTPENLGSVMLKLTVQGNTVSATAIAQNADVRSALMSNQHQLTRSLAEAGLKLTGFSVDISGGNDRDRDTNDQTKGFGKRFTVHETGGTSAAESNENSSVGPSILPSSMLGLFNYLA